MDYTSNANKDQEQPKPEANKKVVEKVVTGEAAQRPRSIGRRFKNIFFGGTFSAAMKYATADILLPLAREMLYQGIAGTAEKTIFGEAMRRSQRSPQYRSMIQYNRPTNPYNRTPMWRDPREIGPRLPDQNPYRSGRKQTDDIWVATKDEAELVVERLIDIVNQYDSASLADLLDLAGLPSAHIDNKWGWTYLNNVQIRQVQDGGYLIELPVMEAL